MKRRGAQRADIEALYRERFRAFVLSVTAMLGDGEAALDVVQDAFALALRQKGSFRGDGNLEAWIWPIVLNAARDRRRARTREARPLEVTRPIQIENEHASELRTFLFALPERQRVAIYLRYYADLSYAQIADLLGVSPGTVASGGSTMNELKTALDKLVDGAPVDAASWEDVQARARRPLRQQAITLGVVAAVIATTVAAPALGIGSVLGGLFDGTPVKEERLSAHELHVISALASGVSPRTTASKQQDLARLGGTSLRQIAAHDGHAYFVANLRGGGLCVSIARIGNPTLLGSILCSPDFPSPARPILDRSGFAGPPSEPQVSRLEGFAADGVASVGVVTTNGELKAVTPVRDNIYRRTKDLPTETTRAVVALDANGKRIYSMCFDTSSCAARKANGR